MSTVAVVGVGSIGGYAAAQLAAAGHTLVLCTRRPIERLVVELESGDLVVDQPSVLDPAAVTPVDWVLLATKAHHNAGCRGWLEALTDEGTSGVLVLQNGIGGGSDVVPFVAPTPVIPSVVLFGAELVEPGRVRHHGSSALEVPASAGDAVGTLFRGTDIEIRPAEDFLTSAWRKLVVNTVSGPLCVLTGRRLEVFHDPDVADLARSLAAECIEVARAAGATVDPAEADTVVRLLQDQPAGMGNSMLYDRLAGRPMEHEALIGAVVREGRARGVETPVSGAVLALLRAL